MNFENSPVGLSVDHAGAVQPANWVKAAVNSDAAGNAWVTQYHPHDQAQPLPAPGVVPPANTIPNVQIPYGDIPWFSTRA
jgi:hypothetical protein